MSALDELLKRHRKTIIDREEKTFRELLAAYAEIERELQKSFDDLQQKIEGAQVNGETISPSWFFREQRLKNLLADVNRQIVRFGGATTAIVEREQRAAIQIAVEQAQETFDFQIAVASREDLARNFAGQLNSRAVENAVGLMGDGSPLREYFEQQLAPMVAERIKSEVIKAAATGTNFNKIAKRLTETGGITKYRALSVARTEVNRVRRETTRQIYQENDEIINGWEWVASKSTRTCPLCLRMDGEQFPLDEPFPQHINCRCGIIAVIIGLARRPRTIGRDWFEGQSDDVKETTLGKESFLAYQQNGLTLDDFVAFRNDKRFGKSVTRRPLAKILADKKDGGVRGISKKKSKERAMLGNRQNRDVELDEKQIKEIKKDFRSIGGDANILSFNKGKQTGYVEEADIIRVRGNILPLEGATHPRSRMSVRAVLAHELQHRKFSPSKFDVDDWRDEFRASFLAALRTPNLTDRERYDLMDDAVRRAEEAGHRIRKTKQMRKILGLPGND